MEQLMLVGHSNINLDGLIPDLSDDSDNESNDDCQSIAS
jgi:hypothetical protein